MDSHRRTAALRRALANTIRDFYHRDAHPVANRRLHRDALRVESRLGSDARLSVSRCDAHPACCRRANASQHFTHRLRSDARLHRNAPHAVCASMRVFIVMRFERSPHHDPRRWCPSVAESPSTIIRLRPLDAGSGLSVHITTSCCLNLYIAPFTIWGCMFIHGKRVHRACVRVCWRDQSALGGTITFWVWRSGV